MFPVILTNYHFEDFNFTYALAAGITAADVGKAVSRDTSVAGQVKLAGDGDVIIGRLEVFENRTQDNVLLGTISRKFMGKLPVKTGETINVGDVIVGAGAGEVKAIAAADYTAVNVTAGTPATVAAADLLPAIIAFGFGRTVATDADDNGFVIVEHGVN